MYSETRDKRQEIGGSRSVVRSAGKGYFAAAASALFFAALLSRFGLNGIAIAFFIVAWSTIFVFALTDRIVVARRRIVRSGVIPYLASLFTGRSLRLKFANIEQIETYAVQRFKRGGNVQYRYRTIVRGEGAEFIIR